MRVYELVRQADPVGVSGVGVVAIIFQTKSGECFMSWTTDLTSQTTYPSMDRIKAIHCHGGLSFLKEVTEPTKLEYYLVEINDAARESLRIAATVLTEISG